jgi:hypothetical protein
MSLEQRVAQLEKALQKREPLPVMVWHEGTRDEALSLYVAEHGQEPKTEIEIRFFAPIVKISSIDI